MIGCGAHAEGSHGPAQVRYAAAHSGTELAACCDVDGARAERHRQRFGFARAYRDVTAMIDTEKPDAAVLAVPVHLSASVAAPLFERGVPTTAIHGLDAVRFLAGADYAEDRFRYREQPALGAGVANVFVDAVLTSGATAHLAFCPKAGAVVERATVHAGAHTLFLRIPMWGPLDSPGRLQHVERGQVVADLAGDHLGGASDACVLGGFYGEYEAFLGDLAGGRTPSPSLRESRQSVEIAECVRRRDKEFRA